MAFNPLSFFKKRPWGLKVVAILLRLFAPQLGVFRGSFGLHDRHRFADFSEEAIIAKLTGVIGCSRVMQDAGFCCRRHRNKKLLNNLCRVRNIPARRFEATVDNFSPCCFFVFHYSNFC